MARRIAGVECGSPPGILVVVLRQRGAGRDFLPATGLLEARELGRGVDAPCRVVLPDHPVTNQVAVDFRPASTAAWYEVSGEGVEVYAVTAAEDHAVVAGRDHGDGRVVLIGFDYGDYDPDSARILANALRPTRAVARPRFVRGDANADALINLPDAVFILNYLFQGGREPPCLDAADVDDSAAPGSPRPAIDLSDAVYLLYWLFSGGAAPPAPSPLSLEGISGSCGPDPQFRDELGCERFPPCE